MSEPLDLWLIVKMITLLCGSKHSVHIVKLNVASKSCALYSAAAEMPRSHLEYLESEAISHN